MHPPWKVLAPIDLASEAEPRVDYAVRVAEAAGGELTLLYVLDPERRRQYLRWPDNSLSPAVRRNVRRVVLEGPVAETVSRFAEEMEADLVALGRGSGPRLPWRRSVAAAVASATDLPVFVGQGPIPAAFSHLVCEVALDGEDGALIETAAEYAGVWDAQLSLVHVLTQGGEDLLAFGAPLAPDRPLSERLAQERMRRVLARTSRAAGSVVSGPRRATLARAVREGADAVLVRRDAGLPGRLDCPVISVASVGGRRSRVPEAQDRVFAVTP